MNNRQVTYAELKHYIDADKKVITDYLDAKQKETPCMLDQYPDDAILLLSCPCPKCSPWC